MTSLPRLGTLAAALVATALLSACIVQPASPYYAAPAPVYRPAAPVYTPPAPAYVPDEQDDPVVSVYVDPPLEQPAPIAVQWAPPPMLVEVPPPQPYPDAIWTGGYWAWEGRWVWAAGRWAPPPRPYYTWVQPYYEHRGDVVVFVPGFWCPPERHFMPPPPGLSISITIAGPGMRAGRPPMGPQGVFVPPPPGSRAGLIVPAPMGTPPAVVMSAPPVVAQGMRVRGNDRDHVTIDAPAGATANGRAFQNAVPGRANLAAQLAPSGRFNAPRPASAQAIPSFRAGQGQVQLPPAQSVRNERGNPQGGERPGQPFQQPQSQPQQQQQPQPSQNNRAEFEQPPRQAAPVNGQAPAWQQNQGRGQEQGQGQQRQPSDQGRGQAQQGQTPQGQAPQQGGRPQPSNPQDPRGGGNPQGANAQANGQPAAQAQAQGQGQAREGDNANQKKDARKKPARERRDDRDKKDGERDR